MKKLELASKEYQDGIEYFNKALKGAEQQIITYSNRNIDDLLERFCIKIPRIVEKQAMEPKFCNNSDGTKSVRFFVPSTGEIEFLNYQFGNYISPSLPYEYRDIITNDIRNIFIDITTDGEDSELVKKRYNERLAMLKDACQLAAEKINKLNGRVTTHITDLLANQNKKIEKKENFMKSFKGM